MAKKVSVLGSAGCRIFPTTVIIFTPRQWQSSVRFPPKLICVNAAPKVYNQGKIGSCTANAIAAAIEFDRKKQKLSDFIPSRLFIYYNERSIERSVPLDNGAQIRDGIKSIGKQGACPESEWRYDDTPADPNTNVWPAGAKPAQKPPKSCYTDAKKFRAVNYQRVDRTLSQMKGCLADGYPFVFGFTVYDSFESAEVARTGLLEMPAPKEGVIGGHAVLAVGYNDKTQRLMVRNSWGASWGKRGYFTMPTRICSRKAFQTISGRSAWFTNHRSCPRCCQVSTNRRCPRLRCRGQRLHSWCNGRPVIPLCKLLFTHA